MSVELRCLPVWILSHVQGKWQVLQSVAGSVLYTAPDSTSFWECCTTENGPVDPYWSIFPLLLSQKWKSGLCSLFYLNFSHISYSYSIRKPFAPFASNVSYYAFLGWYVLVKPESLGSSAKGQQGQTVTSNKTVCRRWRGSEWPHCFLV